MRGRRTPGMVNRVNLNRQLMVQFNILCICSWSTLSWWGSRMTTRYEWFQHTAITLQACWSRVGTAWVNFQKTLVNTNTCFLPSLAGCKREKSVANIWLEANKLAIRGSYIIMCPIPGQKHLCLIRFVVLPTP